MEQHTHSKRFPVKRSKDLASSVSLVPALFLSLPPFPPLWSLVKSPPVLQIPYYGDHKERSPHCSGPEIVKTPR